MYKKARGFTLIELVIVMAVVAIMATIAYPAYQQYVVRATRAEARADVLNIAQLEERWFSNNGGYRDMPAASATLWTGTDGWRNFSGATAARRKYDIRVVTTNTNNNYTITATPVNGFLDPACGVLTITDQQIRTSSGTDTSESCWGG